MTEFEPKVKAAKDKFLEFIDHQPRLGWYIAGISTLNLILSITNLLD